MKKIAFFISLIFGIWLLYSCEKDGTKPVLNMDNTVKPVFSEPADGSTFVFTREMADSTFNFSWSATTYNLDDLPASKYTIEIAFADSGFNQAVIIDRVTDTTGYQTTIANINNALLTMGALADSAYDYNLRISSNLIDNTDYSDVVSEPSKLTLTAYSSNVEVPPLYLIGDGTTIGWDNTNTSLEFSYDPDEEVYKIVATLGGADLYFKAFEVEGQWAPQWGTDETGTSETGPLVYRPTEDVPDPTAIPAPEEPGDYLIIFDLVNLVYTIELADISQSMHLIGDASEAGWDNTQAIPMDKIAPGKFELVANLSADATEGFKFLVNQGAWAPMYGTVEGASFDNGVLIYRETEADPDPKSIPPPTSTGDYLINVDIVGMTYTLTPQ